MSHHASSWAIEQRPTMDSGKGDPYAKLLLLVLADSADEHGVTWRGSRTLGERAGMPAWSVRKVMIRLREYGLVASIERSRQDGSQTSSVVVLAPEPDRAESGRGMMKPLEGHPSLDGWEPSPPRDPGNAPRVETERGCVPATRGRAAGAQRSDPVREPVMDPGPPDGGRPPATDDVGRVFAAWDEGVGGRARTLTAARRRLIANRLKAWSADELVRAVREALAQPFYRGENDRNKAYDDIEILLRNDGKVERFLVDADRRASGGPAPGAPSSGVSASMQAIERAFDGPASSGDAR